MHSPDLTDENIAKIRDLFPGCVTEAKDENGELRYAVDFDQLKQELSDHIVEGPQERYHLNWPGKREALLAANAPIAKTLRPSREESVNFDTTNNLFIEGDNLEALKLLQETYLGKIKMIYIDPPYNTGKDFIYDDDFAESADEYFKRSNQRDEVGNRLVANQEANGRMHSDWLSMIYPRLRLAKNLLAPDGVIFVSINHKEVAALKRLLDEIFGDTNMLCMFAWRTDGNFDNQAKFKYCHEYVLAYARDEQEFPHPLLVDPNIPENSKIYKPEIRNTIVKNGPKNPPSSVTLPSGFPAGFDSGCIRTRNDAWPHFLEDVDVNEGRTSSSVEVYSGWSSKELLVEFIDNNFSPILDGKGQTTTFELTQTGAIEAVKVRGEPSHVISLLTGFGGPQRATAEIEEVGAIFDDYPKPLDLLRYLTKMNKGKEFVVLDFFAGSSSTAHAVLGLNASDGGHRKFIMVQIPEMANESSEAFKAGYKTIAEISKHRIKSAGENLLKDDCNPEWNKDVGFRVLKVDTSNMADVYYTPGELKQADLLAAVDNIKPGRDNPEDLLFQVLVDWGVDLTLPIRSETVQGKTVFFVNEEPYDLIACFDTGITEGLVKELAKHEPMRVVFRDNGFVSDAVKINVDQIFRQLSPATDVKSI